MKLHFHDSVTLRLFPSPPDDVDFRGELFTRSGCGSPAVAFYRLNGSCYGCTMGEQTIDVPVPGGSLLPGMLECRMVYSVPSPAWPGGSRSVCAHSNLPIEVVRGNGDSALSVLAVNIYQPTTVLPPSCGDDCNCADSAPLSFAEIDNIINSV